MESSHTTEVYQNQALATERVKELRGDPILFNVRLIRTNTVGFFDRTGEANRRINDGIPYGEPLYLVQYETTQRQPQPGGASVTIS